MAIARDPNNASPKGGIFNSAEGHYRDYHTTGRPETWTGEEYDPNFDVAQESTMLSRLIERSSLYIDAFKLFSSDKSYGLPYLQQLKMIPGSITIPDQNFWDDLVNNLGGTSAYDKAFTDAFNLAMDDIRVLVNNYQTFISKLPAEQVEQLREAGINASVTGEGVTPSEPSDSYAGSAAQPAPSAANYDNTKLSDGVSRFIEFIGSMSALATSAYSSKNLMGMLDLAEREGYNKQELHDLLLAQNGVTSPSPYRVLDSGSAPIVDTLSKKASDIASYEGAIAAADADSLSRKIELSIGNDPDKITQYEIKTGADWLTEAARFKTANIFYDHLISNLRNTADQRYVSAVANLEGQYQVSNFGAMINEANFNRDFYANRNGASEGVAQTSLSESLANLREAESAIKEVEQWFADYRMSLVDFWGDQLNSRPDLMPFFYKAVLDFDMEDSFYHSSPGAQALKYGTEILDSVGGFISNITGFRKPFKKRGKMFGKSSGSSAPSASKGYSGKMTTIPGTSKKKFVD